MGKVSILIVLFWFQSNAGRTVWDGVYTSDQAKRGQTAFAEKCASCHGTALQGTEGSAIEVDAPPLVGPSFLEKWREDDIGDLFKYIQDGMPREAATTVPDNVKLDILAFLLQSNDFPAGAAELNPQAAGKIMLTGKDGPKPLPTMTPVRAVGCLTQVSPTVWTLTRAFEPARTHIPGEITADEVTTSQTQPLGTLTFKLPNLDFAVPGLKPAEYKDRKVLVKGVIYRQPNNERINVTAMAPLAPACGP